MTQKAKRLISSCLSCGTQKEHQAFRQFKYCTLQCQADHRWKLICDQIESGENIVNYRQVKRYIIEKHGHRCQSCNTSVWMCQPIPLELEHTDGNHTNNTLSNCKVICPNCHALTPTYKNKNKGNGRAARRQRYQDGKSY